MKVFLTKHWSEIITGITGVAAWIFERRKRKMIQRTLEAKTKQDEIESDNQIVDLYQKALNDLKKRYDEKFEDLEKQINTRKKSIEEWKTKYTILKKSFLKYKREHL